MEEYTKVLKEYLGESRNCTRKIFSIVGTLYRGTTKGRFTYEQGLKALTNLGGAN